jgi:hypothetical protein
MTRQKVFLWVAAALFVGWIGYLGYAVLYHRWLNPPDIVSRSQLTAAQVVVVAEVAAEGGKPSPQAKVTHRLSEQGPEKGEITVTNLPQARPPSNEAGLRSGQYLLFLVPDGADAYRIAGWPRGLGESTFEPGQKMARSDDSKSGEPPHLRPPLVYPWTDAVQKQMAKLGYTW